jgi:hypothetical protein
MRVSVGNLLTITGTRFKAQKSRNTVIFRGPNGRTAFAKPRRATPRTVTTRRTSRSGWRGPPGGRPMTDVYPLPPPFSDDEILKIVRKSEGQADAAAVDVQIAHLRELCELMAGAARDDEVRLAALRGAEVVPPDGPLAGLSPQVEIGDEFLHALLAGLFELERPVVLILDDLHEATGQAVAGHPAQHRLVGNRASVGDHGV